jgi:amino acid transporter
MVFVMFAYGGWNEAAYVAAEVRNPRRNMVRALVLGTAAVTALYLAVNAAYLAALGFEGVKRSSAVAADVLAVPLGEWGARAISVLVMVSALGAINGLLFTGLRLNERFGTDHWTFAWLRRPAGWRESPGALLAQAAFSLGLIALVDFSGLWQPPARAAAEALGVPLPAGFGRPREANFFEQLVVCTTPVFWLFLSITGLALPVLRWRDPTRPRPYRVPGYPVVPLLFCGSSLFMFEESTRYALKEQPAEALILAGLLLLGVPLYVLTRLRNTSAKRR